MKRTVYIETSVISYLTARPSRNIIAAAWQQVTLDWWERQRERFELVISELVRSEVSEGDPEAVQKRMVIIQGMPELAITNNVVSLAKKMVSEGALPDKAIGDAMHIAIAAVHEVDYLLTWNYRHLDNAERKPLVRSICIIAGYRSPEICTPQELLGEENDV